MTRRNKGSRKNKVQNVRVMDEYSGTEGAKMERQLNHLISSESQITVLCAGTYALDVSTAAPINQIYGWAEVRATDDFISMRAQFNTYRVRSVRYDIYDINPSLSANGFFSTFHEVYNPGGVPVYSFSDVVDGPDSQLVPPGTGKARLTWTGHTTLERGFQDTTPDSDALSPDFGGLRASVFQGTTAGSKYRVVMKAIVDFRGRR